MAAARSGHREPERDVFTGFPPGGLHTSPERGGGAIGNRASAGRIPTDRPECHSSPIHPKSTRPYRRGHVKAPGHARRPRAVRRRRPRPAGGAGADPGGSGREGRHPPHVPERRRAGRPEPEPGKHREGGRRPRPQPGRTVRPRRSSQTARPDGLAAVRPPDGPHSGVGVGGVRRHVPVHRRPTATAGRTAASSAGSTTRLPSVVKPQALRIVNPSVFSTTPSTSLTHEPPPPSSGSERRSATRH